MISGWTQQRIEAETADAYAAYLERREQEIRDYFRDHPGLASSRSPLMARDPRSALPPGHAHLAERIPPDQRHRWWLSGKSSQMLTLALLGAAEEHDPALRWLTELTGAYVQGVRTQFELVLDEDVLDEHPRTTSIDYAARGARSVICVEAKWTEAGIGMCSCGDMQPDAGACSARVRGRGRYWSTADGLGLPALDKGPCGLGLAYQAVRLIAAADALADLQAPRRAAHAVLVFDAENPMFAGHGAWPGWAALLGAARHPSVKTHAVSWQSLVPAFALDGRVRSWAMQKFGLAA